MPSEIEKLKKEIASLEAKQAEHERKRGDASQRRNELEGRRQELLTKIADGDEAASKELRSLDERMRGYLEDGQAHAAAIDGLTAKLTAAQVTLRRAQDGEAVAALEAEISNFGGLDRELQEALRVVAEKSKVLIAAINGVGQRLTARDEKKFGQLAPQLVQQIRRSVFFAFEEMGKANAAPRPTFSETTASDMRRIIAELNFELAERRMQPARGEKLYRVIVACPGLRDVDARPKDVVALPPDDPLTIQMLKSGTIEESAAEQAA
jgi:chromosome segregation ATPase